MRCDQLIRGGFSFCGVCIGELGLSYAPEKEDTYVYRPAESNVHEETFDGHDGGYFYGVSKQPKEFVLRCYFENSAIDRGIMERIYHLFSPGKSGKLIFARKPWCYYYATVTSSPGPELANYLNGLITITMKAYYPYARCDKMYYEPTDVKHELVIESTAMVEKAEMVPASSFTDVTQPMTIILHNPGTERAPVSITAAGDCGLGMIVRNKTTKQECKFVAMDKAHTTDVQKAVHVDAINGNTTLIGLDSQDTSTSYAFLYHDSGFIDLEPAYPAIRDVYVSNTNGSTVTLINNIFQDVVGQYIFLNNSWHKIINQTDEHTIILEHSVSVQLTDKTMITKMNEIEIVPVDTMDITHLIFSFKPTFA